MLWLLIPCLSALALLIAHGAETNPASAATALEAVEWTLTEINGKPVSVAEDHPKPPTLRFNSEKKQASGFSGVNRFFGSYQLDGETLKFGPLAGTRMAGPPEAMAAEAAFLTMLGSVTGYRISGGGTLELLHDGAVTARFEAAKSAESLNH